MAEHARKMAALMTFLDDPDVLEAFRGLVARDASLLEMSLDETISQKASALTITYCVEPAVTAENGSVLRPQYLKADYHGKSPCDFVEQMNIRMEAAP